jgi:hypothetical protein
MFSGSSNPFDSLKTLQLLVGWKSKMATAKSEIVVSQLVDKVATNSDGYPHVFEVQQFNGSIEKTVQPLGMEIQDGDH